MNHDPYVFFFFFFFLAQDPTEEVLFDEGGAESDNDCEHSFILKDDIGDVCRICGVIKRGIEEIIEYNFSKVNAFLFYEDYFWLSVCAIFLHLLCNALVLHTIFIFRLIRVLELTQMKNGRTLES